VIESPKRHASFLTTCRPFLKKCYECVIPAESSQLLHTETVLLGRVADLVRNPILVEQVT
jgi:hypothetical protein